MKPIYLSENGEMRDIKRVGAEREWAVVAQKLNPIVIPKTGIRERVGQFMLVTTVLAVLTIIFGII
jgi:hypothetical protein